MTQAYYTAFTINSSQISGTLTDFPVVLKPTDNRFRTIANGGHVADANGFDLRPYSDAGLTAALSYQLAASTYDASAGTFEMHVKVASAADGSVIYIGYGDAALNTDGSSTAAWNSGYKGVWHLPNGSSLTAADGTGVNNGTAVNATAGAGQIDGAANFNGTTAEITCGSNSSLNITALPITIEAWVKKATSTGGGCYVARNDNAFGYALLVENSGTQITFSKSSVFNATFTSVVPADTNWHYLAAIADGTNMRVYVDPTTNAATSTAANTAAIVSENGQFRIGRSSQFGSFWAGLIDEVRVSNVARSGDWLLSSYKNQLAPGSFYAVGSEVPVGGGGGTQWGPQLSDQWNRIVQGN